MSETGRGGDGGLFLIFEVFPQFVLRNNFLLIDLESCHIEAKTKIKYEKKKKKESFTKFGISWATANLTWKK